MSWKPLPGSAGLSARRESVAVISQKIVNFENNPLKWMELLMVDLAGLIRLERRRADPRRKAP